MTARAVVLGGGGFIGSHLVERLKREGIWVRSVDLRRPEYSDSPADDFVVGDLRDPRFCENVLDEPFDEVFQLAADMGGAGYIFTGDNDAAVMHNSALVNLNVAKRAVEAGCGRLFYSSSACIYPEHDQLDVNDFTCREDSAYPAAPDSEYGWEKLFGERMYAAFERCEGLQVHVARYHNIYGPNGAWDGGREKAPAALCRKVAEAEGGGAIEVWGDGSQTRSFLYVDDCVDATLRFVRSDFVGPVNIGSEEMVTINGLAEKVIKASGKRVSVRNVEGPVGVRARSSDNRLIEERLDWRPSWSLDDGIQVTYAWIAAQVAGEGTPNRDTSA